MDCADEEEERQNTYIEIVYGDGKLDESKKVGVYKAYPHARPGPRLNDKRQTQVRTYVTLRAFNHAAVPIEDLRAIDWQKITAVELVGTSDEEEIYVDT